jgi:MFS family permease
MIRIQSIATTQALGVSTFFAGFGGGVVVPTLPTLGAVGEMSPFLMGLLLSANRFPRIVANVPAGALVDRFGTRTPLVVLVSTPAIACSAVPSFNTLPTGSCGGDPHSIHKIHGLLGPVARRGALPTRDQ